MKRNQTQWVRAAVLALIATSVFAQQPPPATQAMVTSADQPLSNELNDQLPNWLRFSGEYRLRVEGFTGGGFKANNEDTYLLSRLRLNMFLQPKSWLKFGFQAQDAHVFWKNQNPAAPPFQDAMDLRLGYIEIGDVEKKTMGFRAGRQELDFGDQRLIGSLNWTNTARSFDALRGTFRRNGYRVDLFAASVVNVADRQFDESSNGNYLYGIYGGMEKLVPKATVEPYFLWRRQSGLKAETGTIGISNFGTVGLRWVGKLPANFDYGLEMDKQAGSLGTDTISAWAGHWVIGRTFAAAPWRPHVILEYNYASGDGNPKDGHRGTFDQLYPTGHDKYGLADQVGWKNIRNARASIELKPGKKWLTIGRYDAWWLANSHDALYNAASAVVARVVNGSAGTFVGQELDAFAAYNLSKQIQFGGGYGHIFPGTFLNHATPGQAYNFPYATTTFVF